MKLTVCSLKRFASALRRPVTGIVRLYVVCLGVFLYQYLVGRFDIKQHAADPLETVRTTPGDLTSAPINHPTMQDCR